jgi:hypothetical protein
MRLRSSLSEAMASQSFLFIVMPGPDLRHQDGASRRLPSHG